MGTCCHFGIRAVVCINKYDINDDNTHQIESYCLSQGVEVVAKIPFDNIVTEALIQGLPVIGYSQNKVAQEIEMLWRAVSRTVGI